MPVRGCNRLVEIGKDIADVLDADGKANQFGCDPGGRLLFDR